MIGGRVSSEPGEGGRQTTTVCFGLVGPTPKPRSISLRQLGRIFELRLEEDGACEPSSGREEPKVERPPGPLGSLEEEAHLDPQGEASLPLVGGQLVQLGRLSQAGKVRVAGQQVSVSRASPVSIARSSRTLLQAAGSARNQSRAYSRQRPRPCSPSPDTSALRPQPAWAAARPRGTGAGAGVVGKSRAVGEGLGGEAGRGAIAIRELADFQEDKAFVVVPGPVALAVFHQALDEQEVGIDRLVFRSVDAPGPLGRGSDPAQFVTGWRPEQEGLCGPLRDVGVGAVSEPRERARRARRYFCLRPTKRQNST